MKENRKKTIKYAVLVLILLLGIGYAALTAKLKVDGTVHIDKATWDVHFENVSVTEGSVTANPAPTTNNTDTTEMTYTINFTKPGDFYEFTVDIVNDGTIDAMVNTVSNKTYNVTGTTEIELPPYLINAISYDDGVQIQENHLLAKASSEKIKVRVEFKKDIDASDLPSDGDTTVVFKFVGNFKQADENTKPVRASFDKSSWNDIVTAYNNGEISQLQQDMENGVTREVQLDLDNDGTAETTAHLRIANLSTPTECGTAEFSQTACGLVIEFADIITTHRMNPYVERDATTTGVNSKGGWEYSDMRAYLNSTTYAYESIDYSNSGIYNALPSELRNKIIETKVVSGHGSRDHTNFTTPDKIYLFSTKEVWGKEGTSNAINYDSAEAETRQLDYYKAKGVTTSNYSEAIKKDLSGANSGWWLRSARSNDYQYFFLVVRNGRWSIDSSYITYGVAPAFRIG